MRTYSAEYVASLPEQTRQKWLESLTPEEREHLDYDWRFWARDAQLMPEGDDWRTWLILSGRGWGKTRAGAGNVLNYVIEHPGCRVAVVAPTQRDLRIVCFEGDSGLLTSANPRMLEGGSAERAYNKSICEIRFANGSLVQGYSGEEPGRLRGPQFHLAWCDEIAAWERPQETWDMLQFGLRLGDDPRAIITTTPKPIPLLFDLTKDPSVKVTSGSTFENKAHLAKPFLQDILKYDGTTIGRQEIYAELIDLDENAIIKRSFWEVWDQPTFLDPLETIASIDTAYKEKEENDSSACTIWNVYSDELGDTKLVLRYAWREKFAFHELIEHIRETCETFGVDRVLIEDKASGISIIQELRRRWPRLVIEGINPSREGDKVARAHACTSVMESGRVYVPCKIKNGEPETNINDEYILRPFAQMVVDECASFPKGRYKDLTDTVTQFLNWARRRGFEFHPEDAPPSPSVKPKKPLY